MEEFDLIIVGGGPAGAVAALYARRRGLSCLLLDKARFPRDKICGDALSGKSVAVLHELGLYERVSQLPGAAIRRIIFGSPDHTQIDIDLTTHELHSSLTGQTLPMEGFVIRREHFDRFLFDEARQAANRCVEGMAVRDLIREEGRVCGVRGSGPDGEEAEFRGRLVLGCDGFSSTVARRAGLYAHDDRHSMVALRCYYENVAGLTDQIELHFVDEVKPGYFWIFPVEEGYANVGIGMDHRDIKKRGVDLKKALQAAIESQAFRGRFADARLAGKVVGWNLPVGSKRRKMHGDGLLLLGDAAGLIDPFTGEGIGNALYSARFAVETAVEGKEADDFSAGFLQRYEERVWAGLGDELKTSTRLHEMSRWGWLMNWVIRKGSRSPELRDLICGMMANAVPREQMTSPLFYLKLMFR